MFHKSSPPFIIENFSNYHIFIIKSFMITKTHYDNLYRLATIQRFTKEDAQQLQYAIKTSVNTSYSVCLKCRAQLKHGQKILMNYLNSVEVIEELPSVIEEPSEIIPFEPAIEVDVNEADKVGCVKCKKKRQTKG